MAVDMFLNFESLDGESQDAEHRNEIDVLAWSWGMSQSGTTHLGSGSGAGRVMVQDLSLTKFIDNASMGLMRFCSTGKHATRATLTIRKSGARAHEFYVIVMNDVIVTSVSTGGSGGEDRPTENITLNFGSYKVTYTPQRNDGAAGDTIAWQWDIAANKEGAPAKKAAAKKAAAKKTKKAAAKKAAAKQAKKAAAKK